MAKIITHPGKAHRDDFLACCVAVWVTYSAGQMVCVERRLPVDADLLNARSWVIDVGESYQPLLLNFDHHQPGAGDRCALDLVLEHVLGKAKYETLKMAAPWVTLTSIHDCQGAQAAARGLNLSARDYAMTQSPIEKLMLLRFAEASTIHPDSLLHGMMRDFGRLLVTQADQLEEYQQKLETLRVPFKVEKPLEVGEPSTSARYVLAWDVRSIWDEDGHSSYALLNRKAAQIGADVVINNNARHGQYAVFRQNWATDRVDLSRLAGNQHCLYSPAGGFYAVISRDVTEDELLTMIAGCIV